MSPDPSSLAALPAFARVPDLCGGEGEPQGALFQGDNLAVLEALGPALAGAVRCVYLDPPYNNQERYTHYRDTGSSEAWLSRTERVLDALWPLLRDDGSLWVSIDDRELHHLKVAGDRLFGRDRYLTTIAWQHRTTRENRRAFSSDHEYILVWARDPARFAATRNLLALPPRVRGRYRNPDGDPRGPWQSVSANVQAGHGTAAQFYTLVAPNGRRHEPPAGRCWTYTKERMEAEIAADNLWFGRDGQGVPRLKRFLHQATRGVTPPTLWTAAEVGTTTQAKKALLAMFPGQPPFDTPKPEPLIERVLHIASDPGDLVLDAYLGSGTTAAVAHRMGRRWIGIEQGEHARTLCVPRLRALAEDRGDSFVFTELR